MIFNKPNKENLPAFRVDYPAGMIVAANSGTYFVAKAGLYRLPTERVIQSWSLPVVKTSDAAIAHMQVLGVKGFRDYTLIQDRSNGRLYLVSGSRLRQIKERAIMDRYGLLWKNVVQVSPDEVALHNIGDDLV